MVRRCGLQCASVTATQTHPTALRWWLGATTFPQASEYMGSGIAPSPGSHPSARRGRCAVGVQALRPLHAAAPKDRLRWLRCMPARAMPASISTCNRTRWPTPPASPWRDGPARRMSRHLAHLPAEDRPMHITPYLTRRHLPRGVCALSARAGRRADADDPRADAAAPRL